MGGTYQWSLSSRLETHHWHGHTSSASLPLCGGPLASLQLSKSLAQRRCPLPSCFFCEHVRRSRRGRNAVVNGNVQFPVLDGYGDAGLSVMELPCRGLLTVPSFANATWGPELTITVYVYPPTRTQFTAISAPPPFSLLASLSTACCTPLLLGCREPTFFVPPCVLIQSERWG